MNKRPITIASGQFGDLSLDALCKLVSGIGYDGIEVACHAHLDPRRLLADSAYEAEFRATLDKYGLKVWALGAHLAGQCVGDNWEPRLDNFAPTALAGKPEEIRAWAAEEMKAIARAAQRLGVKVVTCFLGSPIWACWYSFPQTTREMVDAGYARIRELWTPIFDEYDACGVRLALEVHPSEIAYDYYSTQRLFDELGGRPTLGLNFDPSHLQWQGVNPVLFLRDFADRVYHVHMKDVKVTLDGRAGILGGHLDFGDLRRGWNFVSLGHGDVNFDAVIRELNAAGYDGPLSVEWEDSGMERTFGAREAWEFTNKINFAPSDISFDAALKVD